MKKKLLALSMSVMLLLSAAACGSKGDTAQSTVENGIKAVQSVDTEAMSKYWGDGEFDDMGLGSAGGETDELSKEMLKQMTANLTYKIVSAKEDGDSATVEVEFTNVDMTNVMTDFMGSVMSEAFAYAMLPEDQQPSDEEMNTLMMEKFTEAMKDRKDETVTNTVTIDLTRTDGAWHINADDTVADAMFGGMMSAADSLGSAFGG